MLGPLKTVKVTSKIPTSLYITSPGLKLLEVDGEPPSNSHENIALLAAREKLLKVTTSP